MLKLIINFSFSLFTDDLSNLIRLLRLPPLSRRARINVPPPYTHFSHICAHKQRGILNMLGSGRWKSLKLFHPLTVLWKWTGYSTFFNFSSHIELMTDANFSTKIQLVSPWCHPIIFVNLCYIIIRVYPNNNWVTTQFSHLFYYILLE